MLKKQEIFINIGGKHGTLTQPCDFTMTWNMQTPFTKENFNARVVGQ